MPPVQWDLSECPLEEEEPRVEVVDDDDETTKTGGGADHKKEKEDGKSSSSKPGLKVEDFWTLKIFPTGVRSCDATLSELTTCAQSQVDVKSIAWFAKKSVCFC